jgi:hypothetical protein
MRTGKISMKRLMISTMSLLSLLFAQTTLAQSVSVEVTIQSVKPDAKELTVTYKTNLGEKSITLDVSRKAMITLNGKEATLDSLGPGLKATVEYHKELAIVTKIDAAGTPAVHAQPELVEVLELGTARFPWLSEDGLTIYFERDNESIWTAHRKDPQSLFQDVKLLCGGKQPTLSGDGLEMILLTVRNDGQGDGCFHVATREKTTDSFRRPVKVRELYDVKFPTNPCLSSDGLAFYFYGRRSATNFHDGELMVCIRSDRTSAWSDPRKLPLSSTKGQWLHWPYVSKDGLNLYCVEGGKGAAGKQNLMVWSRSTTDKSFANGRYIELNGLPTLAGFSPRYVEATNELVFSSRPSGTKAETKSPTIWIIRNFTQAQP